MKKELFLKEIQNRLPEDIIVGDETSFEFTDDEVVGVLSWLKYFNAHYKEYGKTKNPDVMLPIISKRLRLNFEFYRIPCDVEKNKGKHVIYLSQNRKYLDSSIKKDPTLKDLINTWHL